MLTVLAHEPLATGIVGSLGIVPPYYMGVGLFYGISGYIIFLTTERSGWDLVSSFYVRRLMRVVPVLLFSSLLAVLFAIALPHSPMVDQFYPPFDLMSQAVTAQLLFFGNLTPFLGIAAPLCILGLWSISVEVHFYLTFGGLMNFNTRRRSLALLALAALLFAIKLRAFDSHPQFATSHLFYYEILLVSAAACSIRHRIRPSRVLFLVALAGTLCFPQVPKTRWAYLIAYPLLVVSISYIAVMAGHRLHEASIALKSGLGRAMEWLGERSYVVYVMHFQVLAVAGMAMQMQGINFTHPAFYNVGLMLAPLVAIPIFEFVHKAIEEPGIEAGRRFSRAIANQGRTTAPRATAEVS